MHTTLAKIGNTLKNTFNSRSNATKAILAATSVGATFVGSGVANAAITITGINASTVVTAAPYSEFNVSGAQSSNFSEFQDTKKYNLQWNGQSRVLNSVTAGSQTWNLYSQLGDAKVTARRNAVVTTNNTSIIWYRGTGNTNSTTLQFNSAKINTVEEAYASNNLWAGVDNLFINAGDKSFNNTNIERMDFVFTGGVDVSSSLAFAIFDRGGKGDHDGFKIAAVTSIDGSGKPTAYGDLLSYNQGTWGKYDFAVNSDALITRTGNFPGAITKPASLVVQQNMGGTLIPTSLLADSGTTPTIYGYSLFAYDTSGTGNQLLNWKNASVFPTNTPAAAGYGLDPFASVFVVPEPGVTSLLLASGVGLLMRRRRSNKIVAKNQVVATKSLA